MFTLGALFMLLGLGGLAGKTWGAIRDMDDPPRNFSAKIAKMRLDTKKGEGREIYTYIVTFFLYELHRYASFEVTQKQFDEMLENDTGVLACCLKRKKFLEWRVKI